MEVLLSLTTGTLCIVSFFIGAKVSQTVSKGEDLKTPEIKSPMKLFEEHQDRKEAEKEKNAEIAKKVAEKKAAEALAKAEAEAATEEAVATEEVAAE